MTMQALMQAAQVAPRLVDQIDELIARKALTKEAGSTIRLPEIEKLILDELDRAGEVPVRSDSNIFAKEAEALFLELVEEQ